MRVPDPPIPLTRRQRLSLLALLALVGVGVWAGAIGCSVPPHQSIDHTMDPPIAVIMSERLRQLTPGQSFGEVSKTMGDLGQPAARSAACSAAGKLGEHEGQWIEAYQIEADREYERGLHRTEYLWLYFYNDKLIRWGPAFDWPDTKQLPAE